MKQRKYAIILGFVYLAMIVAIGVILAGDTNSAYHQADDRECDIVELVEAGLDARQYLSVSTDGWGEPSYTNTVYILPPTPVQRLRNDADALERKDKRIKRFRTALSRCVWVLEE